LPSNGAAGAPGLRAHPVAAALCAALKQHRDAVLVAPTGTGKSTVAPLALLGESWRGDRKILMLEPRRVAARAVAARMAASLGEAVGRTVGYRMRLDTRVSGATRIEVVTEGVLTRMLQEDPALEGVACVIFDEFHERSLQADMGLALSLDARRQLGAAFRLVLMSATLDGERVAQLLGDAARVEVTAQAFPVELQYLGRGAPVLPGSGIDGAADARRLIETTARAVQRALEDTTGDVLVFLPGAGEIARTEAALAQLSLPRGVRVLPLHGQLRSAAQDAVLEATSGRKVVLATNIAETSLTIPGVTAVVDTGLARRSIFDPVSGMSRLELGRISRAASEQRRGRAGRVAAGICYRLWSEGAQLSLAPVTTPEILETDLAPLALELARWGIVDAGQLDWLDAPPAPVLGQARELLQQLGALTGAFGLSKAGQSMSRLPVHPRLAAMLLAAQASGARAVSLAARLAALLSERDLMRTAARAHDPDLRTRVELLDGAGAGVDRGALEHARRTAQALEAAVAAPARRAPTPGADVPGESDAGALLAAAFPDRIGQRRPGTQGRYLLSNGRGAAFSGASSLARAPYIVAAALDDREREARIDLAAPVSPEALERVLADRIETREVCGWDGSAAAVLWRREKRLGALVLEEQQRAPPAGEATVSAMLAGVRELGLSALPWNDDARMLQARLQFVGSLAQAGAPSRPELRGWPASDDAALLHTLADWLPGWLAGVTRREQLTRVPLSEALRARLSPAQQRALELLAPRELAMPTGTRVRIDYLDANAPCVSVRLQEVFGQSETPRIGGGAVPVTFKLLSPAQRPLQITRDLAGFWRSSYAEVRKEMRGRYPRHLWPENPLEARPTRGTGRSRGR
jgi:ATP-dependent helicase HrpB